MTGLEFFSCIHIFSNLPPAMQSKIVKGEKKYILTKKMSSESLLVNILDGAISVMPLVGGRVGFSSPGIWEFS